MAAKRDALPPLRRWVTAAGRNEERPKRLVTARRDGRFQLERLTMGTPRPSPDARSALVDSPQTTARACRCCTCMRWLPSECFNRSAAKPNGLYPICKECRRVARLREMELHPERVRARIKRGEARYREKHREELQARDRARTADRSEDQRALKREQRARRRKEWPESYILHGLKQRCRDVNHVSYAEYGGRGIRVSAEFDGKHGLERFLAELGRRPSCSASVDRIDPNGHYEPGNLRWATPTEQARNKRSNRMLTHHGATRCLVEWSEITGISHELIRARIDRLGWSIAKALTEPVRRRRS